MAERPFCDVKTAEPLLRFLFGDLPKLLKKDTSPETAELSEAFGWTCFSFWQCGSAFPSFPENYAASLHKALSQSADQRDPAALVLARLLVSSQGQREGRCGFNQLALNKPEIIRESERLIHDGRYEDYLKAQEKYDEYETQLCFSREFRDDWQSLKTRFADQLRDKRIIYRTFIPERNWERGPGSQFNDAAQSFQAVFDLFCWKYYLWCMEGDRPHLLKASVVFTPLGTQIFIPGYLSFDPKRDLDFKKVASLHRARGITRQGPGFSLGRKELAEKKRLAQIADKEARRRGLTGDAKYKFIGTEIGFTDHLDYRRTKKLLE
ncbi:MAG: hypothetical protein ABL974_01130 [Prosthecobacter sp.]